MKKAGDVPAFFIHKVKNKSFLLYLDLGQHLHHVFDKKANWVCTDKLMRSKKTSTKKAPLMSPSFPVAILQLMRIHNPIVGPIEVPIFGPYSSRGYFRKEARAIHIWLKTLWGVLYYKYFSALLVGITFLFFVLSLSAFLLSIEPQSVVATNGIPRPGAGGSIRPLEMHISGSGLVLLRSVQILAIDGTTILVGAMWGSTEFTWKVRTNASTYETRNFGTRFINNDGEKIQPTVVRIGDMVTVTGKIDTTVQEPTLDADTVRRLE